MFYADRKVTKSKAPFGQQVYPNVLRRYDEKSYDEQRRNPEKNIDLLNVWLSGIALYDHVRVVISFSKRGGG